MGELCVNHLTKTFPLTEKQRKERNLPTRRLTAVNNISFTARSGEILGLLGPNGAGKTTTLRMLATLLQPDSGEIIYSGRTLRRDDPAARSSFAFLTADLKLDPKSTANAMFRFFAELYHIPAETAARRKAALFDSFGIHAFADTPIGRLSQGMRQKVSLAISVLHDPDFIIFDEPTNGLDLIAAREVRDFLLRMREQGKCVILSTHQFDFAEKVCDRAAFLMFGEITVCDTLPNLTRNASLEDVFFEQYVLRAERSGS